MEEIGPPAPVEAQRRLPVFLSLLRRLGEGTQTASALRPAGLRTLLATLHADAVYLLLLDPQTGFPQSISSCDSEGIREHPVVPGTGPGKLRWDGSTRPAHVVPAQEAPGWTRDLLSSLEGKGEGWMLHLPVGRDIRPEGSLVVLRKVGSRFGADDVTWAEGIAELIAVDRLLRTQRQELDRVRAESRSIERVSRILSSSLDADRVLDRTLEASLELLGARDAVVWVPEGSGARCAAARGPGAPDVGTVRPLRDETLAAVFREGRGMILPEDSKGGPQATVPLTGGDRILGALQVRLPRDGVGLVDQQDLLARIADHAAVAYENALLHRAVRTLSVTDPLTGLYNRRQLDLRLKQEFAAAKRGRALSVVLFDVDGFKAFNDREGHLAGDAALAAVGRLLADETRAMNLAARYGGDEFIAVLSDTGADGALLHVERVLRRLSQDPEFRDTGLGLSAGCATFTPDMERPEDLIALADQELYRKKGRSTVPRPRGEV